MINIPKELLDKWQKDAKAKYSYDLDDENSYQLMMDSHRTKFIKDKEIEYYKSELEAKDMEIRNLLTLLEIRFKLSCPTNSFDLEKVKNDDENAWQYFKKIHNL